MPVDKYIDPPEDDESAKTPACVTKSTAKTPSSGNNLQDVDLYDASDISTAPPSVADIIKTRLSFILTLISIVGLFALAFVKNIDVTSTIPVVLGVYVASKSTTKIMHSINASKDPRCNTANVISRLDNQD